jgi:hypothetical protein
MKNNRPLIVWLTMPIRLILVLAALVPASFLLSIIAVCDPYDAAKAFKNLKDGLTRFVLGEW